MPGTHEEPPVTKVINRRIVCDQRHEEMAHIRAHLPSHSDRRESANPPLKKLRRLPIGVMRRRRPMLSPISGNASSYLQSTERTSSQATQASTATSQSPSSANSKDTVTLSAEGQAASAAASPSTQTSTSSKDATTSAHHHGHGHEHSDAASELLTTDTDTDTQSGATTGTTSSQSQPQAPPTSQTATPGQTTTP